MDDQPPIPRLLLYLFGPAAAAAYHAASPRLLLWCRLFDDWLEERRRKYQRGAYNLAEGSWRRLLPRQGKLPWELTQDDIAAHAAWMRSQGCSSTYISHTLGVLSNFYTWCAARQLDPQCPPAFNPAGAVPRPKHRPYDSAALLSQAELDRLLGLMQRDASPLGRRDYALVLARLRLGVPLRQLLQLRWSQIESAGPGSAVDPGAAADCAWVRWRPEAQPAPLPGDVWQAIRLWLSACGRLPAGGWVGSIAPGEYIFTPLVDLPQQGPLDQPAAWGLDRSLSCDVMIDNLRRYGRQVGLPDHKLTTLVLRRTGLRLRLQAGDTAEQIKTYVDGRSTPRDLRYRLRSLPPLPPDPPASARSAVPVSDLPLPQRKGLPLEPGYGIKHGLFAHSQPSEEVQAVLSEAVRGVDAELAGLRLLGRGLLALQTHERNHKELGRLSQAYTLAATRMGMLIDAEKRLAQGGQSDNWAEGVLAALDSIAEEQGKPPSSPAIRAEALGDDAHLAASSRQLDEEIAAMRLVLRRTLDLALQAEQADDLGEYIYLADIYSKGCNRLMSLLLASASSQGRLEAYLRQLIDTVLAEIQKDWPQYG